MADAKKMIAAVYRVSPDRVVCTSGATEANGIALDIAVSRAQKRGIAYTDMHLLVGAEEHPSLYHHTARYERLGITVTTVTNSAPKEIARSVQPNTVCLSLQYVNSRHGLVRPIGRIADACREKQPSLFVHTDAAQATAYFDCSPERLRADAVTVDSGKVFGPQGAGALLLRTGSAEGVRPGTPSVALVCGFAAAVHAAHARLETAYRSAAHARDMVLEGIASVAPDAYVHGVNLPVRDVRRNTLSNLAPHILYISFPNVNHAYLAALLDTDGFAVSISSACDDELRDAVRIGVLPSTDSGDVYALIRALRRRLPLSAHGV